MKIRFFAALAVISLLWSTASLVGAEAGTASAELDALVGKIQHKLLEGKRSEADLADDLKAFDELIAKHQAEKTDDSARIVFMKAMLYQQVLDKADPAIDLLQRIKTDYPDTRYAKNADQVTEAIKQEDELKKIQRSLTEGAKFPDFNEQDLDGKALSAGKFKGKVVLIDFWATWCAPCIGELPGVIQTYEKYHDKGFEIIGISLDQDQQRLQSFTKDRNMTWPQYFDGKGWGSKLVQKYGIHMIPANLLLDGDGKIIGHDLHGDALGEAIGKALNKN